MSRASSPDRLKDILSPDDGWPSAAMLECFLYFLALPLRFPIISFSREVMSIIVRDTRTPLNGLISSASRLHDDIGRSEFRSRPNFLSRLMENLSPDDD
jgi:hypothetical protein